MQIKPILFNTEMVKAILQGRKTQTRRIITADGWRVNGIPKWARPGGCWFSVNNESTATCLRILPTINAGDVLWVRETWNGVKTGNPKIGYHTAYLYKADDESENPDDKWRPSIHMPKEAARLFLRVASVRYERLKTISDHDVEAEGALPSIVMTGENISNAAIKAARRISFSKLWDATIQKEKLCLHGWDANPWVWVIEFERIKKPEEWTCLMLKK